MNALGKSLVLIISLIGLTLAWEWYRKRPEWEKTAPSTQDVAPARDAGPAIETLAGDVSDPIRLHQIRLEGEVDAANRYLSTVLIEASSAMTMNALKCSGVLIAPRLVLTAGHCVCLQHKVASGEDPGGARIDRSDCVSTATVTLMTYQPQKPGENLRALHERYPGEVHPHPELTIRLDTQEQVTSVQANLAVILLGEPVPDRVLPLTLAESKLQPGESLVLSGYGSDGIRPELHGQRRFNKVRVVRVSADHERGFLDQPRRPLYANDSGGPCMRESEKGGVLVGISNRGLGSEPTCMSTHLHKDWLREEILKANKAQ